LFWFHFANGSVMPSAMVDLVVNIIGENSPPGALSALRARSGRAFAMLEDRLGRVPYLAGDEFTAADITQIRAYLARIAARPAYQRAMAKADPGFTPPMS
jgi:glutathione S-transferase